MTKEQTMHRLSLEDEKEILALVESRTAENPKDSLKEKKRKAVIRDAYSDFKKELCLKTDGTVRPKGQRRVCYEDIPEIVDFSGISYKEILGAVSRKPDSQEPVTPQWYSAAETSMAHLCDSMTPEQRAEILAMLRKLLAKVYESEELTSIESPILRLYKANSLRDYSASVMIRQAREAGLDSVYQRRYLMYNYNALELSAIAYAALTFDVSPHWLLGLDEKYPVLAECGETETIMDLFCFLSEERKRILVKAAEVILMEGGAAI